MLIDDRRVVPLTLLAQAGSSLVLAAALSLWQGPAVGLSALLGGAAAVVPNGFLAARLLAPRAGFSARAMLQVGLARRNRQDLADGAGVLVDFRGHRAGFGRPAVFGGFIAAQAVVLIAPLLGGSVGRHKEAMTKS